MAHVEVPAGGSCVDGARVGGAAADTDKELAVLNRMWALQTILTNLFTPQQKLLTKTRTGAKVIKTYDSPRTPARRLLDDHPDLVDDHDRAAIEHLLATANPAQIRRDIGRLQDHPKMYAIRRGPVTPATRRHAAYTARTKITPPPPPRRAPSDESTKGSTRAS